MFKKLKEFFKKIFPPSAKTFSREVARILTSIEWINEKTDKLREQNEVTQNSVNRLVNKMEQSLDNVSESIAENISRVEQGQEEIQARYIQQLNEISDANRDDMAKLADVQRELINSVRELFEQNLMLKKQLEEQSAATAAANEQLKEAVLKICDGQQEQVKAISAIQEGNAAVISAQNESSAALSAHIQENNTASVRMMAAMQSQLRQAERKSAEAVWAQVFNNTVAGCDWLYGRPLSPGRAGVGYPFLYAMFHAISQIKPKSILELGLGQSTVMLSRYASSHPGTMHFVVEPDYDWINFFQNEYALSYPTRILQMPTELVSYKESDGIKAFKNFSGGFAGQRFDFIVIDSPSDDKNARFARIDVLRLMPDCLNEDFVIIIDDAEREGEKNTVAEMENCLKNSGIEYQKGRFSGEKDCIMLTSKSKRYLADM